MTTLNPTFLVVLTSLVVESVGDFVSDNAPDATKVEVARDLGNYYIQRISQKRLKILRSKYMVSGRNTRRVYCIQQFVNIIIRR